MTTRLTGNRRHRAKSRWFLSPLVVLQVEEERTWGPWVDEDGQSMPSGGCVQWRDARMEDL